MHIAYLSNIYFLFNNNYCFDPFHHPNPLLHSPVSTSILLYDDTPKVLRVMVVLPQHLIHAPAG